MREEGSGEGRPKAGAAELFRLAGHGSARFHRFRRDDTRDGAGNGVAKLRGEAGEFIALKAECTHLGCTPRWLDSQRKFKCPCHGSGFRASGVNFEGPAPRPLDRFRVSLGSDGQLVIDRSVVYRGVAGEDPDEIHPQSVLRV